MAWNAPPTFVSGTIFTAANANILSGDLTVLESQIGLYGWGSALINPGSLPGSGSPAFLFQAGAATPTTGGSGAFTITFPNSFPHGVVGAWASNNESPTGVHCYFEMNTMTTAAVSFIANNNGGTVNGTALSMAWFALGF